MDCSQSPTTRGAASEIVNWSPSVRPVHFRRRPGPLTTSVKLTWCWAALTADDEHAYPVVGWLPTFFFKLIWITSIISHGWNLGYRKPAAMVQSHRQRATADSRDRPGTAAVSHHDNWMGHCWPRLPSPTPVVYRNGTSVQVLPHFIYEEIYLNCLPVV